MSEFIAGLVSGGAATEFLRFLAGKAIDRNDERVRKTKDMLIVDIENLRDKIEPISANVIGYFGLPSSDGKALSAEIKKQLQAFAIEWNQISKSAQDLGIKSPKSDILISFRSSLTIELDVNRASALPIDSALNVSILKSLEMVYKELSELRLRLA